MIKHVLLGVIVIFLVACTTKDEQYYRVNPKELQSALKQCPSQQPPQVSCEQLKVIASQVNELAYSLQVSPQGFGNKIIALQVQLAQQRANLEKNPDKSDLRQSIASIQEELTNRLAIVKWLESPES